MKATIQQSNECGVKRKLALVFQENLKLLLRTFEWGKEQCDRQLHVETGKKISVLLQACERLNEEISRCNLDDIEGDLVSLSDITLREKISRSSAVERLERAHESPIVLFEKEYLYRPNAGKRKPRAGTSSHTGKE